MNPSDPDHPTRALFSEDGKTWKHDQGHESVSRIVVGKDPGKGGETIKLSAEIRRDIATHWGKLTCLHLWNVTGLDGLLETLGKSWPSEFRTLDLRGCDLTKLPKLPDSVTELDLGRCSRITRLVAAPRLERVFLNDCPELRLEPLLHGFDEDSPSLIEIDVSRNAHLKSLEWFPSTLKKLVAAECPQLEDVNQIRAMMELDHLDLRGCSALQHLSDLPAGLRHLFIHGSAIRTFHSQTIGEADRGRAPKDTDDPSDRGENVASDFHTRLKFGHELAIMPHAKLLLLGNGRNGKTTLAKRLVWDDLPLEVQREHPELKPEEGERFTPGVQLSTWETYFEMPDWVREQWNAIPEARRPSLPLVKGGGNKGKLIGSVRICDFGGQELYHATHRVFAREGSVFLIVWTVAPEIEEKPRTLRISDEEWEAWNLQRSLRYWLDYLAHVELGRSASSSIRRALVCTRCPGGNPGDEHLKVWAKGVAPEAIPDGFHIEAVKEDDQATYGIEGLRKLKDWIHDACLKEASEGGRLIKPKFFADTAGLVEEIIGSNEVIGSTTQVLFEWDDWQEKVREHHQECRSNSQELDESDIQSVTRFLHEVGDVFQLQEGASRAVIVDQRAALKSIYKILQPDAELFQTVRLNGGYFFRAQLESCEEWKGVKKERVKERLLDYMVECRHIVKIAERNESISDDDVYLATSRWMLPVYVDDAAYTTCEPADLMLKGRADQVMFTYQELFHQFEKETFKFEEIEITEMEYRDLTALVASQVGVSDAFFFRNSMQSENPMGIPGVFRLSWKPRDDDKEAYLGKVDAVLVGKDRVSFDALKHWVDTLFSGAESPFRGRYAPTKRTTQKHDLGPEFHSLRFVTKNDLGISSSGGQRKSVELLVDWIKARGKRPLWYLEHDSRSGFDETAAVDTDVEKELARLSRLDRFMASLLRENRMILVISDSYLRGSEGRLVLAKELLTLNEEAKVYQYELGEACIQNQFCAFELADTIVRLYDGELESSDVLVVLKTEPDAFSTTDFTSRINQLMKNMARCFRGLYAEKVAEGEEGKFESYKKLYERCDRASSEEALNHFTTLYGEAGSHIRLSALITEEKNLDGKVVPKLAPGMAMIMNEEFPDLFPSTN